ncbi:MAG: TonB-dependent receptor [Pseudopedobacter saltans]|uniref:TonB-dependent receptor n=1 Tax=Pseudopedobacter saltans TaxID=151895 RepID=A0A2W5ETX5_9SPHI|nr:MAG: TonB-dependent receptor [Pseudopedobacter saltans]
MTRFKLRMFGSGVGAFLCLCHYQANAQIDTSNLRRDTLRKEQVEEIKNSIPVISLDESDADNSASSDGQTISSVLYGGRDPYFSNVYNFNAARFRIRGYDNSFTDTYINGISVTDASNGNTVWSLWSGLNPVMRDRASSFGLRPVDFTFGDIGGANYIDARASNQGKGLNVNYANTNRNFNHRIMGSYSTGVMKSGWAFTAAASYRYANEGYVKGTYFNGASYFLSIDKIINKHHTLSFTTFGTPTKNGMQSAVTQESIDLSGDKYYNPSWGYQNGKIRSANQRRVFQPYFILNHEWNIDSKSSLTTAVGYQFGNSIRTALDWYNAPDPRPDYYRNLPSYWAANGATTTADLLTEKWKTDESFRQIDWDHLYEVNRNSIMTVNGVSGKRSRYIIQDRYAATKHFTFNSFYTNKINEHVQLAAGISFNQQENRNYLKVNDLLGGDFWVNVNQFAERDFPNNSLANQYDVDNPNRIVRDGDKYGYDYAINNRIASTYLQSNFIFRHFDFFIGGTYSSTQIWREGNVRNGLFPNNSLGKSAMNTFINYAAKGGVTYKIDGRNYLYANAYFGTRAPFADNMFISPRNRNTLQDNISSEKIFSAEAGYILNWEKVKFRLNGFYTTSRNGMDVMSYYDDSYGSFVNFALSDIGKVYYGTEIGVEVPIYGGLTASAAANIGRYMYDKRQHAIITADNTAETINDATVYSKNFHLAQTPEEAYTVSLYYSGRHNWFAKLNGNYFAGMWESINPVRRTEAATVGLQPGTAQWNNVIDQQSLPSTYTVDLSGGKTVYVKAGKRRVPVSFSLGITNLTNNRKLISSGYEQLRYDYTNKTPATFPSKYYYSYGISYFASVGIQL